MVENMTSPFQRFAFPRFRHAKDCRAIFDTVRDYHERFGDLPDFASEALHAIVARGSSDGLQYVKELVSDFKCDVNSLSKCLYISRLEVEVSDTPLHTACGNMSWEFIHCLTKELHCDTGIANSEGELPLHVALRHGCSLDIIKMVWPSGSNVDLRIQGSGDTPLHLVCAHYDIRKPVLSFLINTMHCDVTITNAKGELPLHIFLLFGSSKTFLKLLCPRSYEINTQDNDGNTPLHIACKHTEGCKDRVVYLINEIHCDINLINHRSELPLHIAITRGLNFDIIVLLVSQLNKDIQTIDGNTPLHIACRKRSDDLVVCLVDEILCDVNFTNSRNELPLHIAIRNGLRFDTIVLLVSQLNKDI